MDFLTEIASSLLDLSTPRFSRSSILWCNWINPLLTYLILLMESKTADSVFLMKDSIFRTWYFKLEITVSSTSIRYNTRAVCMDPCNFPLYFFMGSCWPRLPWVFHSLSLTYQVHYPTPDKMPPHSVQIPIMSWPYSTRRMLDFWFRPSFHHYQRLPVTLLTWQSFQVDNIHIRNF